MKIDNWDDQWKGKPFAISMKVWESKCVLAKGWKRKNNTDIKEIKRIMCEYYVKVSL